MAVPVAITATTESAGSVAASLKIFVPAGRDVSAPVNDQPTAADLANPADSSVDLFYYYGAPFALPTVFPAADYALRPGFPVLKNVSPYESLAADAALAETSAFLVKTGTLAVTYVFENEAKNASYTKTLVYEPKLDHTVAEDDATVAFGTEAFEPIDTSSYVRSGYGAFGSPAYYLIHNASDSQAFGTPVTTNLLKTLRPGSRFVAILRAPADNTNPSPVPLTLARTYTVAKAYLPVRTSQSGYLEFPVDTPLPPTGLAGWKAIATPEAMDAKLPVAPHRSPWTFENFVTATANGLLKTIAGDADVAALANGTKVMAIFRSAPTAGSATLDPNDFYYTNAGAALDEFAYLAYTIGVPS